MLMSREEHPLESSSVRGKSETKRVLERLYGCGERQAIPGNQRIFGLVLFRLALYFQICGMNFDVAQDLIVLL
jgi:hypothetical protein